MNITALGATEDGLAVATADLQGSIRLWPVLDGTREPVVIHGTAPRAIALLRDGDGFAIATRDAAGGVELIRTTALGEVRARSTPGRDQPAQQIATTPEGLLILRADQTVELIDGSGAVRSRLTPEPGTHIESLVVRGHRALALIRGDRKLRGRWIALSGATAGWGDATPALPFPIERAVLSPSGRLLAATRPRSLHPALIDLTNGTAVKVPLCVPQHWPDNDDLDRGELVRSDNAPNPLGFLTDRVVACAVMNRLTWWTTDGEQAPQMPYAVPEAVAGQPVAISDRGLLVGTGAFLALATPDRQQYLGYAVRGPGILRSSAASLAIGGGDRATLVIDPDRAARLAARARFVEDNGHSSWLDIAPIDDRYAIISEPWHAMERGETLYHLSVFDGVEGTVRHQLPFVLRKPEFSFEPSTGWIATNDGAMAVLVRYDPAGHRFGDPIRIGNAIAPSRLVVLDPSLSGGVVALAIAPASDGSLIGELRDSDLQPGSLAPGAVIQPRTTYTVPGELRATDRAGQLYVHRAADRDDIAVFRRDVLIARLPEVAPLSLRPSRDGSQIAAVQAPRLVLLDGRGAQRWQLSQAGLEQAAWSSTGDLIAMFTSGLARIDAATGAIADRRCGWAFGLYDRLPETGPVSWSLCDAAP